MRRHVIDTDLYIDLIRTGKSLPVLDAIYESQTPGLFFSSVVAEELWAGAQGPAGRKVIRQLIGPFERHDRILTPTHRDWTVAGRILGRLLQEQPSLKSRIPKLANDCLLAVSAQFAGATVYTRNAVDFRLIQSAFPFSLVVLRSPL